MYYHECDPQWLVERKSVITATELLSLRTEASKAKYSTITAKNIPPKMVSLWGTKHSTAVPDNRSWNDAARGHLYEPFAVLEANKAIKDAGLEPYFGFPGFRHWDDVVVANDGLGWSPDGCDVEPDKSPDFDRRLDIRGATMIGKNKAFPQPKSALEVKCYGLGKHMQCCVSDRYDLDERYQLAVAMLVCPTIKHGFLCFYNPDSACAVKVFRFDRSELAAEMEELERVLTVWRRLCRFMDAEVLPTESMYTSRDIDSIVTTENGGDAGLDSGDLCLI